MEFSDGTIVVVADHRSDDKAATLHEMEITPTCERDWKARFCGKTPLYTPDVFRFSDFATLEKLLRDFNFEVVSVTPLKNGAE